MNTSAAHSSRELYQHYLQSRCPQFNPTFTPHPFLLALDAAAWVETNWAEPETALDFNNFAVIALIEAEQCGEIGLRSMYVDMALEALNQGATMQPSHPLCAAHLALTQHLIGEHNAAVQTAYPACINLLHAAAQAVQSEADSGSESLALGLVYLPPKAQASQFSAILSASNGYIQAVRLLAEGLWRSQVIFYSAGGIRFLQLATQISPDAAALHRSLGLAQLINHQWEGLWHLHQANQLEPHTAATLQALYLTYRELQDQDKAAFWLQVAQQCSQAEALQLEVPPSEDLKWHWTSLPSTAGFTYVPTIDGVLLAVDPSFRSIVTSVLLAEGDWFETEMEFWRTQLQPGMTAIDVGANVGVYTFSAAQRVGAGGRVLAVEPFSSCVRCLQETRRINQLDWVTVCAGAASDRLGTARLALHSSSELNEVVREESASEALPESPPQSNKQFEEITCYRLDDLIEQENLQRLDWLKIDAEGHEMQVLAGSDRLLDQFSPAILYENIAAGHGSNLPVAKLLQAKGYQLFRYQPYLQVLIPIQAIDELQGSLNIIALPPNHPLL
jgi:FkbM family methyltransferase